MVDPYFKKIMHNLLCATALECELFDCNCSSCLYEIKGIWRYLFVSIFLSQVLCIIGGVWFCDCRYFFKQVGHHGLQACLGARRFVVPQCRRHIRRSEGSLWKTLAGPGQQNQGVSGQTVVVSTCPTELAGGDCWSTQKCSVVTGGGGLLLEVSFCGFIDTWKCGPLPSALV